MSIDIGLQFAREKQYDEAIQEFTSLLSKDQTYADVYFYRGCAYLHLGQYEKAIDDFSSAIPSPNLSAKHELLASYKRGYAYYRTNQLDSAMDDYRHYIDQCENNQEQKYLLHKGLFQMGIIQVALNDQKSAISYFTDAITSSVDTDEDRQKLYYLHRGRAYACMAEYDQAKIDLNLVLKQSNDLFVKGCAYNELGQHHRALTEFDNLSESNGNQSKLVQAYNDHILFRQGLSCASLDSHEKAIDYFQSALTHSQRGSSSNIKDRILFRRGMSNMELNHLHEALADFNQSTELNQKQSDVFYARGMLYYKLGRHDAAVYDQRRAMELERKPPSVASTYKTFYHMDEHKNIYNYYKHKKHEAEKLLEKYKDSPNEPLIYYDKARYSQNQAGHSDDPLESLESARGDIKNAGASLRQSVTLAMNSFLTVHYLAKKYLTREMSKVAIEQYIDYTAESILCMSELFNECVKKKREWSELITTLNSELSRVNKQRTCSDDMIWITFINNQLERIDMIQEKTKLFADSPAQKEFYGLLLTRLWNLFDGIRATSIGIFPNQLQGTYTKISWTFKLLEKLFQFVPVVGQYGQAISGICESGLKALDEQRIESVLNHLGRHIDSKTADAIATEITKIYENQINRFLPSLEEEAAARNNNQQQGPPIICSKCVGCLSRCCHCFQKQKDRLLNDMNLLTIEIIVEYGNSLALSCLVEFKSKDTRTPERIQSVFINSICRPPKRMVFNITSLPDKIQPKDAQNDKEYWNTYDFFRRPVIDFGDGERRAKKRTDLEKFGCRRATSEERALFKTNPERFDKLDFKEKL